MELRCANIYIYIVSYLWQFYEGKKSVAECNIKQPCKGENGMVCLFVLRFYGPVNPMGSCQARSVYLTTRLLGRLSPLSG